MTAVVSMISSVITMGKARRRIFIEVPVKFHPNVEPLIGKQIRVDLSEAIPSSPVDPRDTAERVLKEYQDFNKDVKKVSKVVKKESVKKK